MPRAQKIEYDETAAAPQSPGCFIIPPFVVITIGFLLAYYSLSRPIQTNLTNTTLSPIFTPEIQYWTADITRWANASSLDPNLVATIMQIESCGDPRAQSRAGAMGLFQVMPFHFSITDNPFNPEVNATRGLSYLSRALKSANGDTRLAMAGYNGGISVIFRAEWLWPAETQRYVYYGAPIYDDAHRGVTQSNMLNEWYIKFGASLCRQASQRQASN